MQPGYRGILRDAQKKMEVASKEMDDIKPLLQNLVREEDLSLLTTKARINDKNDIIREESEHEPRAVRL